MQNVHISSHARRAVLTQRLRNTLSAVSAMICARFRCDCRTSSATFLAFTHNRHLSSKVLATEAATQAGNHMQRGRLWIWPQSRAPMFQCHCHNMVGGSAAVPPSFSADKSVTLLQSAVKLPWEEQLPALETAFGISGDLLASLLRGLRGIESAEQRYTAVQSQVICSEMVSVVPTMLETSPVVLPEALKLACQVVRCKICDYQCLALRRAGSAFASVVIGPRVSTNPRDSSTAACDTPFNIAMPESVLLGPQSEGTGLCDPSLRTFIQEKLADYNRKVIENRDRIIQACLAEQYAAADAKIALAAQHAEALMRLSQASSNNTFISSVPRGGDASWAMERKSEPVESDGDSDAESTDSSSSGSSSSEYVSSDDGVEEKDVFPVASAPRASVGNAAVKLARVDEVDDSNWWAVGSLMDSSMYLSSSSMPSTPSTPHDAVASPGAGTSTGRIVALPGRVAVANGRSSSASSTGPHTIYGTSLPIPIMRPHNRMRSTGGSDVSIASTVVSGDDTGAVTAAAAAAAPTHPASRVIQPRSRLTMASLLSDNRDVAASLIVSDMTRFASMSGHDSSSVDS